MNKKEFLEQRENRRLYQEVFDEFKEEILRRYISKDDKKCVDAVFSDLIDWLVKSGWELK